MTNRPKRRTKADSRNANATSNLGKSGLDDLSAVVRRVEPHIPVAGIVASAGGLNALNQLFNAMPADSGIAFVVVPHLDAKHKSLMVELLSRRTSMPAVEVTEGIPVEANRVYIIPPNRCLTLDEGNLRLSDLPDPTGTQTAIDVFLRSLAIDQGERAIGIVLSGTGSHGTQGIREIKRCGGMAIAQSPESAEFDQMPCSVIETGLVDFVLPPEQMPETLLKYVQQPYVTSPHGIVAPTGKMAEELNAILKLVRDQTKYDFSSYRKNMLMRRIERRMGLMQLVELETYLQVLRDQPHELQALCKDFLIGVTAFFREPNAFAVLEKEVIPALVSQQPSETPLRVWVPSCATGEEAYSIAILLFEALIAAGKPLNFQVFASDINDDSIAFARRGVYPASIATDISADRLKRFFETEDELHYHVSKQLRDSIVFSNQNLILDAPFSKIDLISCRNVLIYFEPEVQQKLISLFHFALNQDGYLILGPSETIGREVSLFEALSKKWRVYRRVGPASATAANLPFVGRFTPTTASQEKPVFTPKTTYKELAEDLILSEYAPASALINRRHEILNVTGPLVNFLEFPAGEISKDLLALARPGLRTILRSACHQAIQNRREISDVHARVKRDGRYFPCSITIRPVLDPNQSDGLMLVLFRNRGSEPPQADAAVATDAESLETASNGPLVDLLEYELKTTREELQSTTEQLRCGIEELQSSNEELESSKEELQSLNEELNTVNCQLLEKVTELDLSNSEISDLMASTEIATLFLDHQLRVKRFTHAATKLLQITAFDEDQFLQNLDSPLIDAAMLSECQTVLKDQKKVETEISTQDGQFFLRRSLPNLGVNSQAKGVVVTFIDLTERKLSEDKIRDNAERLRAILETASDAIITIDKHGIVDSVNQSTESLFGYTCSELVGSNVSILMPAPFSKNDDRYIQQFATTGESHMIGTGREVICQRKDGSTFPADLAVSQVDHLGLFTGILRDISSRKEMQRYALEMAANEQRRIGLELHDGTQQELTGLTLFANALIETINLASTKPSIKESDESKSKLQWTFAENDYERLRSTASLMAKRLGEANRHVRDLSHGIMPVQLDAEGLRSALQELAESMSTEKVHCRAECSEDINELQNTTATHLYRIAQEAMSNAIRHGAASQIEIALKQDEQHISLEVADNGIGFQTTSNATGSSPHGMGMRTMEYRASLIGGVIQIENLPDGGTLVRCLILDRGS